MLVLIKITCYVCETKRNTGKRGTNMRNFLTIDEMELFEIDGGESYNMVDELLGITGQISDWFKGLFA